MRYGSVCSGIEAASVAWLPLGWECAFVSEIDPFCNAVLTRHFPEVPNLGDFTTIGADVGPIGLLVGGTPCQSFSVAGLRGGMADARGNLALEFIRLADRLRPKWVVWENVPGILSSADGRDFGAFLGGLAECGYGFAYRVLDAQFFGVPQRRRRVFVVGHSGGNWTAPAAVLFESASLSGHPVPRREAGQVAPSLAASGAGTGRVGGQNAEPGFYVTEPAIAPCQTRRYGKGADSDVTDPLVYQCQGTNVGELGALRRGNGHLTGGVPFTTHTLRAEGHDVSEDGTGRGVPLVPVAFSCKDHGQDAGDLAPTLRAMEFDDSHINGGGQVAVAFSNRGNAVTAGTETLRSGSHGALPMVSQQLVVRRLTPRECERLQGFPDDWTLTRYKGKPAADANRYRALGNSMATVVMSWLGQRIESVTAILGE